MSQFQTGTPPTDPQGSPAGAAHFTAAMLQAVLTANKITAMVALAWEGPQLNTFTVSLGLGTAPEAVERLTGALAIAAGADSCRVARSGGRLLLEIPRPAADRRTLRAERLEELATPAPTAVPLGVGSAGGVVWLDLADERNAHLVVGGVTGSGKSMLVRWLLYRLARQNPPAALRLLAIDPKRTELAPFARLPHLAHPVTNAPVEIARLLSWLITELDRRLDRGQARPRLLVIVEEVADLVRVNPEIAGQLARVVEVGRGAGVHLLATTQQPGARSLGEALVNFPTRILGRVASATLTYGAAGRARTAADMLLGRGDMLLLSAGDAVRFQAPLIDGRLLGALPHVDQVDSLEAELPGLALAGDLFRDRRGGRGRRELEPADYQAIGQAIEEGATVDELRARFGIGTERARRIRAHYLGAGEGEV